MDKIELSVSKISKNTTVGMVIIRAFKGKLKKMANIYLCVMGAQAIKNYQF